MTSIQYSVLSMRVLDFIFPKRRVNCKKPEEYICTNCFTYLSFNDNSICLICNKNSINGLTHPGCRSRYRIDGSFSSLACNSIAKKLIYRFKYKPFLLDLQSLLSELFYEGLIQNETLAKTIQQFSNETIVLVPIPLHSSKLRKRGYNQAEILAKGLSLRLGIPMENALTRVRNTKTQFKLGQVERKDNMKSAFALNSKLKTHNLQLKGKTIFLVDVILTSGPTLSEAANVLKRKIAAKVFGLTLAREQ